MFKKALIIFIFNSAKFTVLISVFVFTFNFMNYFTIIISRLLSRLDNEPAINRVPSAKFFLHFYQFLLQSNLYKMAPLGTTQKWFSWASGCLIKHLYKTTTSQMGSFLADLSFFFSG